MSTTDPQQAREEMAALVTDLRRAGWTVETEGYADRGLRWKRTVARSPWRKVADPLEQAHAMDDLIIEGRQLFGETDQ